MQADKFFVDQVGIHERDVVPYLSVIPQLQVTAPACTVQDRAAIPLTRIQYRVKLLCLLRDLNILNLSCFPLHCSELAQAFFIFLLRDSSLINHSIWQEQVLLDWYLQPTHKWGGFFFHSSDVCLCEKRICGCSGKMSTPLLKTEVVRLREQQPAVPPWGTEPLLNDPRRDVWATCLWEESL